MTGAVRTEHPLLPPPVRRPAMGIAAAGAVVAVSLGVWYHDDTTAGQVDSWISGDIQATVRGHRPVLHALEAASGPVSVVLLALVLATVFGIGRRWRLAVLAVVGPGVTGLAVELGKHVVGRTIAGGLALPSGHTAGATSVLLVVALAVLGRVRAHVVRVAVVAMVMVTAGAAVVGATLVSLDIHYATDTVAGFCTATAVTLGLVLTIDSLRARPGGSAQNCPE